MIKCQLLIDEMTARVLTPQKTGLMHTPGTFISSALGFRLFFLSSSIRDLIIQPLTTNHVHSGFYTALFNTEIRTG